jgi:hypothetical protein
MVGPVPWLNEGLCVYVILRAMNVGDEAPDRSNQAYKVEGERPD